MQVSTEVLAKQQLDIRLIVNDENERVQMRSPDLIRAAPARGEIRPSINPELDLGHHRRHQFRATYIEPAQPRTKAKIV
jgi:hypothetical protein